MIHKPAWYDVMDVLKPADFYRPVHAIIFRAIRDIYKAGEACDLLSVQESLRVKDNLDAVGGTSYLAILIDSVISAAHAGTYAASVKEKSVRRELITIARKLNEAAYNEGKAINEIIGIGQQGMIDIASDLGRSMWQSYADLAAGAFGVMEQAHNNPGAVLGIPSGIGGLDHLTCGFNPSDLIVIAALTSRGKSILAQQIAENAAKKGFPVAIFSLEMSSMQLSFRAMQVETGFSGMMLRHPTFGEDGWATTGRAVGALSKLSIYVNDRPGLHYTDVQAQARRMVMEHGVKLVIVDYLQLVEGDRSENRTREVGVIAMALKNLAKELGIPVIALAQLSRRPEQERRKPNLSDLRESGSIEHCADVVIFIHHEPKESELIVAKNRQFATGAVVVNWVPGKLRFYEATNQGETP